MKKSSPYYLQPQTLIWREILLWIMVLLITSSSFSTMSMLDDELKLNHELCKVPFEDFEMSDERDSEEKEENEETKEFVLSEKAILKLIALEYHNYSYFWYFTGISSDVPPPQRS